MPDFSLRRRWPEEYGVMKLETCHAASGRRRYMPSGQENFDEHVGAECACRVMAREHASACAGAPGARASAGVLAGNADIVVAARSQVGVTVHYDRRYRVLAYPGGDVPAERGVCTDVIVRALRTARAIDLQRLVHEDMKRELGRLSAPAALGAVEAGRQHRSPARAEPHDLFQARRIRGAARPRGATGLSTRRHRRLGSRPRHPAHRHRQRPRAADGTPFVVHNIGAGAREEDILFRYTVIGHYRLPPAPAGAAKVCACGRDTDAIPADRFTVRFAPADMAAKPRIAKQADVHGEAPEFAAPVLRRFPLQQARAGAAVDHEPAAGVLPGVHDDSRRRAAFGRGLGGRAHRRQRGRGDGKAHKAGAEVDIMPVMLWVLAEALILVVITGRAPRHHVLQCVAQGQALQSRQRDDPREGADARAHAFRRLGVLRQAHARAPRSVEPAAVAGHAYLGAVPERHRHRELLGAARRILALGRGIVLVFGGLPAFFAETKFSGDAFRLFRWRAPETRMQSYLETALAREDHAKEVKLFDLGKLFLGRYKAIYEGLYEKDRNLTIRREAWGFTFTLVSIAALYSAYAWCAVEAVRGAHHARRNDDVHHAVPPGAGRGYRQPRRHRRHVRGQPVSVDAVRIPRSSRSRRARGTAVSGPDPEAGVQFENVEFRYPGSDQIAITGINLQIKRGE